MLDLAIYEFGLNFKKNESKNRFLNNYMLFEINF